jgi:hypothetical protein
MAWAERLVALAAVVGAAMVALAPAPPAARGSGPKAVAANFPSSVEVGVPGPGDATVTSPTLPATAKRATITVTPDTSADARLFDLLTEELTSKPTRGARVIACVLIYASVAASAPDEDVAFGLTDPTLQDLFLHVCLRLALALPTQHKASSAPSSASKASCSRVDKAIGVRITRSGAGYRAQVEGRTHKPRGRSSLVISCQHKGKGLQITIRPRLRGRTLQQAVGSTLGIGFTNPTTSRAVHVRTTFQIG